MKLTSSKFFSLREELKLFATIAKSSDKSAIVDMMLFQLLSLTGLRISEALALRWQDLGEDFLIIRAQKNGMKNGTVFIGDKLNRLLAEFKLSNPYAHSEHLFNTQKGPYKRSNAHERLKYWLKAANLRDSLSLHSFRHTYATRCLDAGLPLTMVRDQLRHSSITVTSVYLHFSQENKDKLKEVF